MESIEQRAWAWKGTLCLKYNCNYISGTESTPHALIRLEGLGQLKNRITASGIQPATFRLIANVKFKLKYSNFFFVYLWPRPYFEMYGICKHVSSNYHLYFFFLTVLSLIFCFKLIHPPFTHPDIFFLATLHDTCSTWSKLTFSPLRLSLIDFRHAKGCYD
jgi:hypothetical protein